MRSATSQRADDSAAHDDDTPAGSSETRTSRGGPWRVLAIVLGAIAAACAIAYPLLPVVQDTVRIQWPDGGDTSQVNAPLSAYWAQDMQVQLPCQTMRDVDERAAGKATLFSTVPTQRISEGKGLQVQVDDGMVTASNHGEQIARQPLSQPNCDVHVSSDVNRTQLTVGGETVYSEADDVRPRVIGIYTDIDGNADSTDGLSVSITPDTRYESSPTALKLTLGIVGVLALLGCIVAVNRLDRGFARRAPRWAPVGWWRLTGRDVLVIGVLGAWVFIGPVTSDDGYILSMARVTEDASYLTNYYRWFGVAEAPFGWFYHVYQLMSHVSVVPPWIRLPSFLLGVLSWLLISREVMPRLGKAVRSSRAAGWAAATVFLVWWMPYNNGVRPEPVAAAGSLLAICAVERALVTRRLLPVCLGLLAAAFTLAATPTGLIAVAPFLVAAKPLYQLLRQRAREIGWLPTLAPILGAGLAVLFVIFADQTLAAVAEATRLRSNVGPSLSWYQELSRYQALFGSTPDGAAARRFPVVLLMLCVGTCVVVLLRRGRIAGAALGPTRRLIATVVLFFGLMALTPTKWTHHFGAFAAVGAAMAALTALATSSSVLRSKRNRAAFVAALLVMAAFALTGPNAYWFVSKLGVPWNDIPPQLFGIKFSTLLLVAAGIAAVIAFVENIRVQRPGPVRAQEGMRNALWRGSLAFVVVCGLFVVAEVGSMGKAIVEQRGSYSLGAANVDHVLGKACGLGDHVMVERDPTKSILDPLPAPQQRTLPAENGATDGQPGQPGQPGRPGGQDEDNGATQVGFHTQPQVDGDPLAGPPHGFTSDSVPMWTSYEESANPTGRLRSDWYGLEPARETGKLATAVYAPEGVAVKVDIEFGQQTPQGVRVVGSKSVLAAGAGKDEWTDVRLETASAPKEATTARVVATDDDLTKDGWVAVTAPRAPSFTTLTQRVGDAPVYLDWPTSFAYPCLNPVKMRDGIMEVPKYHITPGDLAHESNVAGDEGGGPLGILDELTRKPEVPSYLAGDPDTKWGTLEETKPYASDTRPPKIIRGEEVHPGWWQPGPGPQQPAESKSDATRR